MKKLTCLLLIVCILCPLMSGCIQSTVLDDDLKDEIIQDYLSWSGLWGDVTLLVKCSFLGKYGNSVAVYFQSAGAYDVATEETVAGFTFRYPDSRVIRIWNNGKFYKMTEAYEKKLIRRRNVKEIYNQTGKIVYEAPLFIWEDKVYFNYRDYLTLYSPEMDAMSRFTLIVAVDTNISSPEKVFDRDFFESIEVKAIRDITESENELRKNEPYRRYFELTLRGHFEDRSRDRMFEAIAILEAKEGIREALPIHEPVIGSASAAQNSDADNDETWGFDSIEVEKVWDFTTGSSSLRVGVIDTGIASHPDLDDNYLDIDAYDFRLVNLGAPMTEVKGDSYYHGTHVAGIIGASWDNNEGIIGINRNVRLTQLRTLYSDKNQIAILNAIDLAAETLDPFSVNTEIPVLNMSIQHWYILDNDLKNTIRNYCNNGGLLICIAGNNSMNLDINYESEKVVKLSSIYEDNPVENIITVGAIDIDSERWVSEYYDESIDMTIISGSNYGFNTVDIYARV